MTIDLERIYNALGSRYWCWTFHLGDTPPAQLLTLLTRELPHIPPDSWPERFAWGGVFVNGRAVSRDISLTVPCKVEYYEPKLDLERAKTVFPVFDAAKHIVFEDDYLLVVFKPAKLPCLPQKERRVYSLINFLEQYLHGKVHMPSRLDLSVSGLLVVSKSMQMHASLQHTFEQRSISKFYLLEVSGRCDWREKLVDAAIDRDPRHPVLRKTVALGGKPAKTLFESAGQITRQDLGPSALTTTFLRAKPVTGRTHQIRIHAASLGLPIIGDNFYGGLPSKELRLLSYRIRLKHPITENVLDGRLPNPLWPDWADNSLANSI
jgi:RluA family pseudouridine synthase